MREWVLRTFVVHIPNFCSSGMWARKSGMEARLCSSIRGVRVGGVMPRYVFTARHNSRDALSRRSVGIVEGAGVE